MSEEKEVTQEEFGWAVRMVEVAQVLPPSTLKTVCETLVGWAKQQRIAGIREGWEGAVESVEFFEGYRGEVYYHGEKVTTRTLDEFLAQRGEK